MFMSNFLTKPTLMPQRFLQEESATLAAMKALLEGRAPTMAKGIVQPICDGQVEKPQRVTGCQWVGKTEDGNSLKLAPLVTWLMFCFLAKDGKMMPEGPPPWFHIHLFLLGELTVCATPKWLCGWCHFEKANFGWIRLGEFLDC